MFPDLIEIGDFTVHTYGVLVALGLIVSYLTALYFGKREKIDTKKIDNLFTFTIIGGIVGARIAYILEHPDQFKSFFDYVAVWKGGIDWFGAFIGGASVLLILLKKYSISPLKAGDVAGISIIVGHAIGRVGCTAAGCCYGKPVPPDSPFKDFAITFPHHEHSSAPAGIPLYPTQPAEAVGNFLIFLFLLFIYRKKRFDGQIFSLYLILYGLERFLLEFWRGVTPPIPHIGLTWNQIITLGMVAVGIIIYFYGYRKNETVQSV
ncbi:MAG: prolipoprotein diacylglyceryl transferase [Persephonella sp.]|nr:prolipoprotein diacylglyceryl transferase [Persephonella sp.]